ncbi:MAG: hypothetical protein JJ992_25385 [Planctomycetes bacterium]|nr:hypothetical protein [Planctomycetota bacterium]
MALIRLVVFGFLFLSIVYLAISWYSRSVRREKLEDRWLDDHPGDTESPDRDAYIKDGMTRYEHGLRKKLIWLVYVVPTVVVIAILVITNTN